MCASGDGIPAPGAAVLASAIRAAVVEGVRRKGGSPEEISRALSLAAVCFGEQAKALAELAERVRLQGERDGGDNEPRD